MKVLVADPFEPSGIEGLRAAGCEVVHDPALKDEALVAALGRDRGGRPGRPVDQGDRRDAGCRRPRADRPGRRRLQHDRCRRRIGARDLRLELPRQERRGRGGTHVGADPRPRPADPRQRHRAAGRAVEQEGVRQGQGPVRVDAGLLGFGSIAQEVARRAQAFGLHIVVWSRRFAEQPDRGLRGLRSRVDPRVAGLGRRDARGRGGRRRTS